MSDSSDQRVKNIYSAAEKRLVELRERRRDALRRLREAVEEKRLRKAKKDIDEL